jgi:hypothetical protein
MNMALTLSQMLTPGAMKAALLNFLAANNIEMGDLNKSIARIVYYDQRPLVSSSIVKFFGSAQGSAANTNMKNANYTLPADEHFMAYGIRILYGNGATLPAIDWLYGADTALTKNCLLKAQFNTQIQLNLLPLTTAIPDLTTDDNGFILFHEPILWAAQTAITIEVTTQGTIVANDSLRIELHGFGFTS